MESEHRSRKLSPKRRIEVIEGAKLYGEENIRSTNEITEEEAVNLKNKIINWAEENVEKVEKYNPKAKMWEGMFTPKSRVPLEVHQVKDAGVPGLNRLLGVIKKEGRFAGECAAVLNIMKEGKSIGYHKDNFQHPDGWKAEKVTILSIGMEAFRWSGEADDSHSKRTKEEAKHIGKIRERDAVRNKHHKHKAEAKEDRISLAIWGRIRTQINTRQVTIREEKGESLRIKWTDSYLSKMSARSGKTESNWSKNTQKILDLGRKHLLLPAPKVSITSTSASASTSKSLRSLIFGNSAGTNTTSARTSLIGTPLLEDSLIEDSEDGKVSNYYPEHEPDPWKDQSSRG